MKWSKRNLVMLISGSMMVASVVSGCATEVVVPETPPPVHAQAIAPAVPAAPQQASADDLDQLVAPIALYPDALVAQILAAATYPTELVEADRWMQQHNDLKGDALAKAVDAQAWDPSVKALTQFPSVLQMMDKNLSWTSALGDAYVNEQDKVLDSVQVMRRRAQQAGNLKSTQQETVTSDGDSIDIEPADPEVVYVPEYDPWIVYGPPLAYYPGWVGYPGLYVDGPGIGFGLGIGIGFFGGFGWGWHHWGADWHHHDLMHDGHRWASHSPTFSHHGGFGHEPFPRGGLSHSETPHTGLPHGEFPHAALPRAGGFHGGFQSGTHSSAFSGFNHGGVTSGVSARGHASFGGGYHASGGGHFGGGHK